MSRNTSALRIVRASDAVSMDQLPALLHADAWAAATQAQRETAMARMALVHAACERVKTGASINAVAKLLLARVEMGETTESSCAARLSARVSVPTLKRWMSAYTKHGRTGLLPKHTGRVRQDYGWETRAIELFNSPSKPNYKGVALYLVLEGYTSATPSRVRLYLQSLPSTLGAHGAARVGQHQYQLTHTNYVKRSLDEIVVGEVYAGDGHTCDVYVAHPESGGIDRLELTLFMDIKSGMPVGWHFSEAESGQSTLFAISHALATHNHMPAWVYIDRGSGYRAKMLSAECTGWFDRMHIGVVAALPGNANGKGWIERLFRTIRDYHDKLFAGGEFYCGDDMARETNRRLSADIHSSRAKRKALELAAAQDPSLLPQLLAYKPKRTLPTAREYINSLNHFLTEVYPHMPLRERGDSPANLWAALARKPVHLSADALLRPAVACTVARQRVRLHGRVYQHAALELYARHSVRVEYSVHDDRVVWIFDGKGRQICEAELEKTISVLPASRIEEGRQRRATGQLKRIAKHHEEIENRRPAIEVSAIAAAVQSIDDSQAYKVGQPAKPVINIQITDYQD